MWTTFYGFASRTLNLTAESTARMKVRDPKTVARWAMEMTLIFIAPMIWEQIMTHMLRGDDDDEPFLKETARRTAAEVLGLWVGLREFGAAARGFRYQGTAGAGVLQEGMNAWAQAAQGEMDEAAVRAFLSLSGIVAHLPMTQAMESYRGARAWLDGEAPISAVLVGAPRKR
jgi:hypothetical protein